VLGLLMPAITCAAVIPAYQIAGLAGTVRRRT